MLIDGKVKLLGSMNWSKGAGLNSEDLNLVVSPEVAETYAAHWRQRLSASVAPAGAQTGFRRQAENRPGAGCNKKYPGAVDLIKIK